LSQEANKVQQHRVSSSVQVSYSKLKSFFFFSSDFDARCQAGNLWSGLLKVAKTFEKEGSENPS
jgi:hypothetical protein